ncbi:hypothetical protein GINT2_001864 [Glugoides intestinalis]
MEYALEKLEEAKNTTDIENIKLALDRFKRATLEDNSGNKVYIDKIIKCLFQNNGTAELFDRITELFDHIKDPRNFLDELDGFTENKTRIIPTLMFIHELQSHFNLEYEEFYSKLYATIEVENCNSEGYLLFLLKALKDNKIEGKNIEPILSRLGEISVEISSTGCVKVLYTIIVILRMHPWLFRMVKGINQLYLLLQSFEPIARIARRIFIEAENPEMRPTMVFLENFVFPTLEA